MKRTFTIASFVLVLFASTISPSIARNSPSASSKFDSIVSMLEAGLSEEVITAWLDGETEPLPRPSADQLIALNTAGASDALLKRLLAKSPPPSDEDTVSATSDTATESPAPADRSSSEPEMEIEASAKLPSITAPRNAPSVEKAMDSTEPPSEVMVNFTLSYTPWYLNQQSFDPVEDYWDFFVYLDGIPLSYVPPASITGVSSNLEFSQLVPAGRHIVRVTLERHKRSGGDSWSHRAMVAEQAFPIDVAVDGPEASLTVRFRETWAGIGGDGPLQFTFQQGDEITELDGVGGDPETWPLICEEIEANLRPRESPGRQVERDLATCLAWDTLWEGVWSPPRSEVREALAMFEYRPVPKGS